MAKVTSKVQITIPKRIAEQYGIAPGDEIEFLPAGDVIHLAPARRRPRLPQERRRLFGAATARQRIRLPVESPAERDWRREDLYTRGKPR